MPDPREAFQTSSPYWGCMVSPVASIVKGSVVPGLPLDTIVCGDNVTVMSGWPDACVDLTVTSPPYDNLRTYGGHTWDFEAVAQQLWRVTKPGGVVVWVVADATVNGSETGTSFRQALRFMEIGFRLHDTMIYNKPAIRFPKFGHRKYCGAFEFMFVLSNGSPNTFNPIMDVPNNCAGERMTPSVRQKDGTIKRSHSWGRNIAELSHRNNVWSYLTGKGHSSEEAVAHDHPATFPESLARDHILSWSNEGDVVCDPFAGSGTTLKMARAMGRRWVGIEINPDYVEIGRKRMRQQVLEF